jgi:hypothetical protein
VVCSSNVSIQNNTVIATAAGPGIDVTYTSSRDSQYPDFTLPTGISVANNTITIASGQKASRVIDSSGTASKWEVAGMFDLNTYCVPRLPWTESSWMWGAGNPTMNWTTWQATGQSPVGTPTLSPCSGSVLQQVVISGPVIIRGSASVK